MKILTKIWKKHLNEAGIPVLHIIDELRANFSPIWEIDKTPQIEQFIGCPSDCFDVISFRIE
jgi:hypothetical protein